MSRGGHARSSPSSIALRNEIERDIRGVEFQEVRLYSERIGIEAERKRPLSLCHNTGKADPLPRFSG